MSVKLGEIAEVRDESRRVLAEQMPLIDQGRVGHQHWWLSMVSTAKSIVRRRRAWEGRRRAGHLGT